MLTGLRNRVAQARRKDVEALREEIESLTRENRERRDPDLERRLMQLRQLAGIGLAQRADARCELVEPAYDELNGSVGIPEVTPEQLTPELLRAAILRHGSIIVRGLVDPGDATRLADGIDKVFEAREAQDAGEPAEPGYYEELQPEPPNDPIISRGAASSVGGALAADSPRVAFEMLDVFGRANMREIIGGYLSEAPVLSAEKTTLRRADPSIAGAWHQDGKFLGDVNSLNLWLSLSHCGDTAPGLDLVPHRVDHIVEAGIGDEGFATIVVAHEKAVELSGELGIVRPIFEPGDAIFFDHLCLHQTASEPDMPNQRYAIESWFFGPSAFPEEYMSLAL